MSTIFMKTVPPKEKHENSIVFHCFPSALIPGFIKECGSVIAASVLSLWCYVVLVKVREETLTLYTYFSGNRSHWTAISDDCGCSSWIQHQNSTWDTSLKLRDAMWGLKRHHYTFLLCSIRIHRSVLNFEWCFLHASLISKVLFNRGTQISRWRYFIMSYPQITYRHHSCQKSLKYLAGGKLMVKDTSFQNSHCSWKAQIVSFTPSTVSCFFAAFTSFMSQKVST